jgi:hypothetical protein
LSIEYPTSSVRVQYTTVSVGISTLDLELLQTAAQRFFEKEIFNKYRFQIDGNIDTIWRVEQFFHCCRPKLMPPGGFSLRKNTPQDAGREHEGENRSRAVDFTHKSDGNHL